MVERLLTFLISILLYIFKKFCFKHSNKLLYNIINQLYLCFQTDNQLNMALRRSQWNGKKSSDELELKVPESEMIIIEMEEVEMPEEIQNDKKRQPSEKTKTIGPNIKKQKNSRNISKLPLITCRKPSRTWQRTLLKEIVTY